MHVFGSARRDHSSALLANGEVYNEIPTGGRAIRNQPSVTSPNMADMDDREAPPTVVNVECPMCHTKIPLARTTTMSGRRLCLDCANSWFDDEEESEKSD
jgi:hypothetical protein